MNIQKQFGIVIMSVLLLSACGNGGTATPSSDVLPVLSVLSLTKTGVMDTQASESTPFVFNGRLLLMTSIRIGVTTPKLRIWDYQSRTLLTEFDADFTLPCAFVDSGRLYIFGITNLDLSKTEVKGYGNQVIMISTTDLVNWTPAKVVYTFPSNIAGYNLSVTKGPTDFVMAYDFGGPGFNPYWQQNFLHSSDLCDWQELSGHFQTDPWSSGISLRYDNGWYYLFYSTQDSLPHYFMKAVKSQDLITWESAKEIVIFPDQGFENINTTDLDLVEDNGQVFMSYTIGDQSGNASMATAFYNGTFEQMVKELF